MASPTSTAASATLKAALETTTRAQLIASDPALSAWVSANAGTGKTHVLTMRVLRLLLAGTEPERILALTFTKAAAAEMSKRVFDQLAGWVTAPPPDLALKLGQVLGRAANAEEKTRARRLFASAIETPGGLKVQTIHGFCERLLKRFPLEAGIPPHFEILDEATAGALLGGAIDQMLIAATQNENTKLARALRVAITFAADDSFDDVLGDALRQRDWLAAMMRLDAPEGGDPVDALYRRVFDLPATLDLAASTRSMAHVLDEATLKRAVAVLGAGKSSDQEIGAAMSAALGATSDVARATALKLALMTGQDEPRVRFITKDIRTAEPALTEALCRARDAFPALLDLRQKLVALEATTALVTLADAVLSRYQGAKARRAALDFDDLIGKAASLLATASGDGASPTQWVLYKLDGGLDHILVDEAQDTSPAQWSVISALAAEFFADGAGHGTARTLFAVGDEKQSIYGFQGAAPQMFKEKGEDFQRDAAAAGQTLARVPLDASFRTTPSVLQAVDRVFENRDRMPGVSTSAGSIRHLAMRAGQAGVVEVWQTEPADVPADSETWSPNSEQPTSSTVVRLANRIADCIKRWLDEGEMVQSENRRVRASDILILVRRRRPFAPAMVAALKARQIAVAGADRLTLIDQIAVQDLMALGDFLTLPEDDLALACVLKSPLFGLGEDALMQLAYPRKGQLWTALLADATTTPCLAEAAETLKRWRSEADYLPPFEFFAQLLDRDNGRMRRRMLSRLGAEAADPIDELLNQALKYDDKEPASLTGFLAALRASNTEIKRDMEQGRNEVRVMTVHGAKGLEAPIVILPDTCSDRSGGRPGGLVAMDPLSLPIGVAKLMLWPVKSTKSIAPVEGARAALKDAEQNERNRLLYVALTRARDRLYITGYEGRSPPPPESWYAQVKDALVPLAEAVICADGRQGLRLAAGQTAPHERPSHGPDAVENRVEAPVWVAARPKTEPRLTMPLAPSRLAPLETDDTGEPVSAQATAQQTALAEPPMIAGDPRRFLRGTLTHALLELLPGLPRAEWAAGAERFLAVRGKGLGAPMWRSIARETIAVLSDPTFAPLFGPDSQAEVPIVAEIPRPHGKGPPLRLNGQIDRLARVGRDVLIVDYKTNRPPPSAADGVAESYLLQLAAYRLALLRIFPGSTIKAAILWTDGARLMPIPAVLLDGAEQRLWQLDVLK